MCQRNTSSSFKTDCWPSAGLGPLDPWLFAWMKNGKHLVWFISQISWIIHAFMDVGLHM